MKRMSLVLLWCVPAFGGFSWSTQLTYDHTKVGAGIENESNFPAVIFGSDASLKTTANGGKVISSSGADILAFSDSACSSQIPSELEFYDGANGILDLHVKLSLLSSIGDGSIYLCVGNAAPPARMSGVWDSYFQQVLHVSSGTTLNLSDSSGNGYAASGVSSPGATAGKIDGGVSFNGSGQYLTTTANIINNNTDLFTVSAWAYPNGTSGSRNIFASGALGGGFSIQLRQDNSDWNSYIYNGGLPNASYAGGVIPNTWSYVVTTWDGSNLTLYVNGLLRASTPATSRARAGTLSGWGNDVLDGFQYWLGSLDEMRVSNVARSAGWISTEYQNGNAPGNIGSPGFWTWGSWRAPGGTNTSAGIPIVM
ncbi:MAG TPA: LamG domain-containing protein [Verrucomicrobiae bacterium]|nr:LamG domain-containing protein [Verrucomicrobiae bacterium]